MIIPKQVKELFEKQALVSLATANKNGNPNIVPIFWKKIASEDRILLIDNFMKTTKQNISENNKVCISFWNPETEEAYKVKGMATYHTEGLVYEEGKKFIQEKKPDRVPKGVVEIKVTEIFDIKPGETAGEKI